MFKLTGEIIHVICTWQSDFMVKRSKMLADTKERDGHRFNAYSHLIEESLTIRLCVLSRRLYRMVMVCGNIWSFLPRDAL